LRPPAANEDPVLYWRPELQDSDPRVRVIAIGQLTQVPEEYRESAAEVICEVASDENVAVRRAVMSGLSIYKSPSAVPAAIKGLEDADPQVARSAAALLGQYKEESAIGPLVAKYPTLGDVVVSALAAYGNSSKEKVVEAYKSLMGSGDPKRQLAIMTKLVQADPASAAPMLGAYVADGDLLVRTTAINLLGELKYEPAIPAIVDRLREDSEAATQALLKYGPAAEVATAGKLQDGEPKFRLQALEILKEIATPLSLPAIKAAARDPDMSVALAAREVWRKIEPGALTPIDEALMDLDGDKELLIRSLKALATLPVDEHQTLISRKLYDIVMGNGEKPIPSLACDALAVWADAATRARMIEALKPESDDQKKVYAIRLAVQFKDPRAVRPLCECLAQGRCLPEVMDALIDFGTLSETYLMRLISQGDSSLQTKAFSLLREIGTRRCFMVITPLLGNKNTDVELKKQAKDTIIAINRRLNSAAARKAPPMMPARPLTPVPAQP
jgi:HEAT repeat protein